jgi:hypothetical protein
MDAVQAISDVTKTAIKDRVKADTWRHINRVARILSSRRLANYIKRKFGEVREIVQPATYGPHFAAR